MPRPRPGQFVALDVGAHRNRKFLSVDPGAIGLWTMGLSYCGDNLTDGLIPRAQIPRLVSTSARRAYGFADELVEAGLWERKGDDYLVHDYLDWNRSRQDVEAIREFERMKKRGQRASRPQGSPSGTDQGTYTGTGRGTTHGTTQGSPERSGSGSSTNPPTPLSGQPAGQPQIHDRKSRLYPRYTGVRLPDETLEILLDATGLTNHLDASERGPEYTWPGPPDLYPRDQWLPGPYPWAGYHHDCPEPKYRGWCVRTDFAWPGLTPYLQQCPGHAKVAREGAAS